MFWDTRDLTFNKFTNYNPVYLWTEGWFWKDCTTLWGSLGFNLNKSIHRDFHRFHSTRTVLHLVASSGGRWRLQPCDVTNPDDNDETTLVPVSSSIASCVQLLYHSTTLVWLLCNYGNTPQQFKHVQLSFLSCIRDMNLTIRVLLEDIYLIQPVSSDPSVSRTITLPRVQKYIYCHSSSSANDCHLSLKRDLCQAFNCSECFQNHVTTRREIWKIFHLHTESRDKCPLDCELQSRPWLKSEH